MVYGLLVAPVNGRAVDAATPSPAADTYQTAASILSLPHQQLDRHLPAHLHGQVIRSTEWGVTLLDRTAGIWVYFGHPFRQLSAGDELDVIGTTNTGLYSPVVNATSVRKVGHSALPKPVSVNFKKMSTGNFDAQYVTITGIVRAVGTRPDAVPSQNVWMKVEMADGTIDVAFPEDCAAPTAKLIDAVVRFKGAGSSAKNQNLQLTAPTLMMSSMAGVTVLRPAPKNLFLLPLTPIGGLMQYRSGTDFYHRVLVAGAITYYKPGESLIIEDQGQALFVETPQIENIHSGDQVEVLGFPAPSDTGPILRDALIRDLSPGKPLQPAFVSPDDLSTGKFNYNLVSTEGRLLRKVREPARVVLLLQVQSSLLLAELADAEPSNAFQNLEEGSTIRVSGISLLGITGTWNTGGPAASSIHYRVLLRSPDDVLVLQTPSWWTRTRVIYVAGLLAILALVFLAMVVYGRREGWRLQAVLGERERLANEVHDTLAQSFAGIGFQLQAIRKAIPEEQEELRQQIDLARALVRHSHKEARRSIEPLNSEAPEEIDILSALAGTARTMVNGGAVEVSAKMIGTPRTVPPKIAASLLRIGQEAIANAVRHADPSHLRIVVDYRNNFVRLSVEDDGCGFVKSGGLLGFGLRGMRKRAAALSAKLEITSNVGHGTCVEVTAPLPPSVTLPALVHQVWRHFSESFLDAHAKAK